jgi:hypothetical protein
MISLVLDYCPPTGDVTRIQTSGYTSSQQTIFLWMRIYIHDIFIFSESKRDMTICCDVQRSPPWSGEQSHETLEPLLPPLVCSRHCLGPSVPVCVLHQRSFVMPVCPEREPHRTDHHASLGRLWLRHTGSRLIISLKEITYTSLKGTLIETNSEYMFYDRSGCS